MNKKRLHHIYSRFRTVSPWVFLGVAIVWLIIFIFAFRQNNLTMLKLRAAVTQADQENGDVESALRDLREYVYSHMNTDLTPKDDSIRPPIQLKYRYERLLEAEKQRVAEVNIRVYSEAQAECERRFPQGLSGSGRIPCITEYVTQNGTKEQPINDEFYKFDFVSPRWSPDLAGWSMVFAVTAFLLFAVSFGLDRWFIYELHRHQ